jgi:hypothetical protein
MGMDAFALERWAALGRGRHVGSDAALDGIATEPAAGAGREQRILWCAVSLCHPDSEDGFGLFRERDGPVLASLTGGHYEWRLMIDEETHEDWRLGFNTRPVAQSDVG